MIGFSTSNFQPITEFLTGTVNPFGLAVSPNGSELYVASQGDNKAYIYSTDGSLIKSITLGTNPADVAFEPNGNLAYVTILIAPLYLSLMSKRARSKVTLDILLR